MADKNINRRNNRSISSRHIANIRETIEDIRETDNFENHADHAQALLTRLKSEYRINTLFPKIKKYQSAQKTHKFFENYDRSNQLCLPVPAASMECLVN